MAERAREAKTDDDAPGDTTGAGGVASEVKAVAGDLRSAAVEQGRQLLEGARQHATSYADERKNEAAASVSDVAASLRETSRSFGERPHIQSFVDSAADGLEQLATGLRERSFAELYGEAESYAKRSPLVVGAVAAAAGFVLARFIKSSADELSVSAEATRTRAPARRKPPAKAEDRRSA